MKKFVVFYFEKYVPLIVSTIFALAVIYVFVLGSVLALTLVFNFLFQPTFSTELDYSFSVRFFIFIILLFCSFLTFQAICDYSFKDAEGQLKLPLNNEIKQAIDAYMQYEPVIPQVLNDLYKGVGVDANNKAILFKMMYLLKNSPPFLMLSSTLNKNPHDFAILLIKTVFDMQDLEQISLLNQMALTCFEEDLPYAYYDY